jgi:hypothetical protein
MDHLHSQDLYAKMPTISLAFSNTNLANVNDPLLALATSGGATKNRNDQIFVTPQMVAKASKQ